MNPERGATARAIPGLRRSAARCRPVSLSPAIRYIRSVLRLLLLLLLSVLLTSADRDVSTSLAERAAQWSEAAGGDCCPPKAEPAEEAEDCCDDDFGMCCIGGVAILPSAPLLILQVQVAVLTGVKPLHPELLHPRANGPPLFRPPIA